jgi:lipopolysaccharide/colanic/teichoic acid biosynthesis glycosyltransferase
LDSSASKAVFDRAAAAVGLVVLSPLLAAIALAIVLDDRLPILFRQTRVGRNGRPFRLAKFRSMRVSMAGARITAGADPRITRVGRILRRYKLDELPQLWNVLIGDLSLVGPRPEIPAFVEPGNPLWREVLSVRPGITDLASLQFRHEEQVLGQAADPERYYRETILPAKLALNREYIRRRSFWLDLKLILLTLRSCLLPHERPSVHPLQSAHDR